MSKLSALTRKRRKSKPLSLLPALSTASSSPRVMPSLLLTLSSLAAVALSSLEMASAARKTNVPCKRKSLKQRRRKTKDARLASPRASLRPPPHESFHDDAASMVSRCFAVGDCSELSIKCSNFRALLSIVNAALAGSHSYFAEEQTYVALIDQKISKAHFL